NMSVRSKKCRLSAWLLGAVLALVGGHGFAYQMSWTVVSVRDGNGTTHAGPPTTYRTKTAAIAAMQALAGADSAGLTYETGIRAVSRNPANYQYIGPPTSPVYSDWQYTAWYYVNGGSRGQIGGTYADQAPAAAALEQWRPTAAVPGPSPPCVAPTLQ